jgi:regulator of protease activity HflC (stomatin/prohibitin superfamily)
MKRNIYIALAIMLCSWTMAYAQDQKFAIAAKQNAAALQQYTWKSQTQIRKEGDVKATKLYSNRYAADGTVVQLLLQEESAKLPKFGIRGMVAKKKKAEAQELIESLQRFAKSYGELPPAKMQEFMKTANATLETNAAEPLLRLESTNILQPGDSMIVWLDANTRRQRRVEINSTFDEKPVRIVTEFRDLPSGPTYVARSVVDYRREELTLTMENFDYEHLAREEEQNLQD